MDRLSIEGKTKNRIISLLQAFVITFAIYDVGSFSSSDILLGIVFVVIYTVLYRLKTPDEMAFKKTFDRRTNILSAVTAFFWTGSYLIYASDIMAGGMENRLFVLIYQLLATVGIFVLVFIFARWIITYFDFRKPDYITEAPKVSFSIKKWLIYSLILLTAMLPLFVLNYPGTMTVDSFEQLRQARDMMAYSDHHPWVHTIVIKLMYSIGYGITGNVNAGIATYVLFQMIVTALSVGYAAAAVAELGMKKRWSMLIILGYILYPYHLAYAITIWKDILFSDMVLVLTVTVYRIIRVSQAEDKKISLRDAILFLVSSLGMCMFRHNGLYAYIPTTIALFIYVLTDSKKKKNNMKWRICVVAMLFVVTLILSGIVKGPLQSAFNVEKGSYAHNLAIPLQQIGRTVKNDGDISKQDMTKLEKINTAVYMKNNYEPGGADNMIQWLAAGDSKYFEEHKLDYLGVWLRIGINNPKAYIDAYIAQTKGYYTTMMPEQIAYYGILPNEDNLENTPIAGASIRIKINELLSKIQNMIPVYGIFYSMGACLMIVLLGACILIKRRDKAILLVYMPVVMLIATILIATPLVADLRYAYPLMLCFPTLIAMTLGNTYSDSY